MTRFHLYIDDSGTRHPNRKETPRIDGMDYFALGGILINEDDIGATTAKHAAFQKSWNLQEPLHSTKIRGRRGPFSWLKADEANAGLFYQGLNRLILDAPIISISCVIDRPGYVARYAEKYPQPWLLCQTAFAILLERSCKFVQDRNGLLVVYFEETGKHEDRAIMSYMKSLRTDGMPFAGSTTSGYENLSPAEFSAIVEGEPKRIRKTAPMIQFADLVLYAMARGGYDNTYEPFQDLHARGRIIDSFLEVDEIPTRGVKYSCFDTKKARNSSEPIRGLHSANPGADAHSKMMHEKTFKSS